MLRSCLPTLLFCLIHLPFSLNAANDEILSCDDVPDYLIIGAGGAGLQTALLLLNSSQTSSFALLEKESSAGSFWSKFPRFEELISINKSVRNETQRYRYDWHSFLGSDLGMLDVTLDYFPSGRDWQRYMARVVEETPGLKERVEYGVEVEHIASDGKPCVYLIGGEKRCARRRIFVGTGLKMKDEPLLRAIGGIPYLEATKERARNKRACILGNGNSGFELAQNLYSVADRVTLYGRSPHRLSAVTRYTGDVRVKYLQALENLNGKLLDTVDFFTTLPRLRGEEKLPLDKYQLHDLKELVRTAAWLDQFECEAFFYATGVQSVVPGMDLSQPNDLFPATKEWYSASENPSVHYVGWLMHGQDFRQGAGGFFSGYRYLIRNLVRHVLEEDHGMQYPHRIFHSKADVAAHGVARVQVADDLIILQDGRVLRDVIIPEKDGNGNMIWRYYEGATYDFHKDLTDGKGDDIIYLYLAWGNGKTVSHVFDGTWRYSDTQTLINMFLHPVVQVGPSLARDIHEDLDMSWTDPAYVVSIEKVMMEALDGRVDKFLPPASYTWKRSVINQTEEPGYYEAANLKTGVDNRVFQALWKAIYTEGTENEMKMREDLTASMKSWQPALFEDN